MSKKTQDPYANVVPVGGELGTSTSKFCVDDQVVCFSSVIGDALTTSLEENWRRMNRSRDNRWIRNLAIWDDLRKVWRYVGAMTRSSEKPNWFTERGLVQNMDDAYVALQAGLFLLNKQREETGKDQLTKIGLGFGVPVKAGENAADEFFSYLRKRLKRENGSSTLTIRAKNVATGFEETIEVDLSFITIQFQGYGAYMALLFGKFGMKLFNTYVVDIGHGTWIKLPVIEHEVDMLLADSIPQGMHTITENISRVIFEKSRQRFRIPEQRIMEKLPRNESKIEIPGEGVFDFAPVLDSEVDSLCSTILTRVRQDLASLSRRGQFVEYFAVIGGGSPLVIDRVKEGIRRYYDWPREVADTRVIDVSQLGLCPRTINAVGFMLLARDQIALEQDRPVDPSFRVTTVVTDDLRAPVLAAAAPAAAPRHAPAATTAAPAATASSKG